MMTANEAKKRMDDRIDKILTTEVPVFLKNICEAIDNACKAGEYKCTVSYNYFHPAAIENVILQLKEMEYQVDNIISGKKILIWWM